MASARQLMMLLAVVCALQMVSPMPSSRRSRRTADEDETEAQDTPAPPARERSRGRGSRLLAAAKPQPEEPETTPKPKSKKRGRHNKAMNFFGYIPKFFASDLDWEDPDDDNVEFGSLDDTNAAIEDISRTIPQKQNNKNNNNNYQAPPVNQPINSLQYDSPIFYIRMPPTPYMFVPGLGYVSQPPSISPAMAQSINPFINVPIDFVSNGKPTGVYQWSEPNYEPPSSPFYPNYQPQKPQKKPANNYNNYQKPTRKPATDSKVTNLKGQYAFNGKPSSSVFVLRDSYNSLYADALQNFYP